MSTLITQERIVKTPPRSLARAPTGSGISRKKRLRVVCCPMEIKFSAPEGKDTREEKTPRACTLEHEKLADCGKLSKISNGSSRH